MITVLPDRVIGPGSVTSFEPKMRGIEVTSQGIIRVWDGRLFLAGRGLRPPVRLGRSRRTTRCSGTTVRTLQPLDEGEALVYQTLAAASRNLADGQQLMVTGPLKRTDAGTGYMRGGRNK
jgi:hypothetical protein